MSVLATLLLAGALALAISWLLGALALRAAARWPALAPDRTLPALLLAIPLVAAATAAAVTLVPVEHAGHDPSCHHDGHGAVGSHASLGRDGLAVAVLPLTLPLALLLTWRCARCAALGIAALRGGSRQGASCMRALEIEGRRVTVVVADLGERNARAAAWPGPRVVFDRAWWDELAPAERRIIVAHEAAHLRRRDPWITLLACLASALLPGASWRASFARWRGWAERAADLGAARAHGDAMDVAELLVEQQRRWTPRADACLAFGGGGSTEARVRALAFATTPEDALESDLGCRAIAALAAGIALPLAGAGFLHRAIEIAFLVSH